ncbi:MAG: N-acetylmuramoyl-L-alanine amidase [Pedobacter sp.]|nr:MAG: N-acetylmuramoyl-L-alanine amidase [Pedobacter sp.]
MILIYLLKVSACTLIFFAAYQFLLARLTFFKLNRLYLLSALLFSFIIPALTIESKREVLINKQATNTEIAYSSQSGFEKDFELEHLENDSSINWNQAFEYLYVTVLAALIIRTLAMIGFVKFSINKNISSQQGKLILVRANSKIKNCSFLNKIIVDESLSKEDKDLVIRHESAHVNQAHAFDKLLVNFAANILWFNPIIYFWRNAIDHNHEFLADYETLKTADKKAYASLLLNLAMPSSSLATHSFSKLPLKKRIMMLYKKPNPNMKKLVYFSVIPLLAICLLAFVNRKEVIVTKNVVGEENSFTHANVYKQNFFKTAIVLDPNAKPAFNETEVVLVLDAGHGGKDAASVALDGQREKDMNLRAVNILKEEAAKRGIKIRLTRSSDEFVSLRDRLPMQAATAFISIHHNATPKNSPAAFGGIEVYVSKLNKNIKVAEELGAVILSNLKKAGGINVQDSLKNGNLLLLRESKTPAVLIELGNITNQKSLDFISQEINLRKISNLILDGFVTFSKRGC